MSLIFRIREYKEEDSENVFYFLSDILANEFNITLDFDNLDSDLLNIRHHYNRDDGGCFWIVKLKDNSQIIGTVAMRKLKESKFVDANNFAELKRMFLSKQYRGQGIGQQMLDTALDYAKKAGYSKIFLYSSQELKVSRYLYLKNRFMDIPCYNKDPRADVFMKKVL
jgi:GNAT superfamily N-acetyltransferase